MKKITGFLILSLSLLSAQISVSIKPLGLLIQEIFPGKVIVVIPPNRSPHIFSPSPMVVRQVVKSKMLFKIGAGLESWKIPNVKEVDLSKYVHLIVKEGRPNPHYWLSPKRMLEVLDEISEILGKNFPDKKEIIKTKSENERKRLEYLDRKFREELLPFSRKTIVLYRPAFVYLISDYGMKISTILTNDPSRPPAPGKLKDLKGDLIILDPSVPRSRARLIESWTKIKCIYLDPLASGPYKTYEEFMMANLKVLIKGLK